MSSIRESFVPAASFPAASRNVVRGAAAVASSLLLCLLAACGGGGGGGSSSGTDSAAGTGSSSSSGSTSGGSTGTSSGSSGSTDTSSGSTSTSTSTGSSSSSGSTGSTDTSGSTGSTSTTSSTDTTDVPTASIFSLTTGATTTSSTLATASTTGSTYYVGGSGTLPSGSVRVATMAAVPWATLAAGSKVIVAAGTYAGVTTISGATGTSSAPIVVTAADTANPPVFTDSFNLIGDAYLQLTHLVVSAPTYAGFIIRQASNHVTVAYSTVSGAPEGVNVTDGAGIGNRILYNSIVDSTNDGINLEVNSSATERSLVRGNVVQRSAVHGIEVRASHYQIDYNTVSGSGQSTGGASGIHLYSASASEDSGDDNVVSYNRSYANLDSVAYDGNGIEADHWCDGNVISYNLTWSNDGAGILVYDGSNNVVRGNTAWNNGLDSGNTHSAGQGQIMITGTSASTVAGNQVWNNLLASTKAAVPALYVDTRAVSGGNTIGANLYYNSAAGRLVRWTDSLFEQTAALIATATGATGGTVEAPAFANTASPLASGLKLSARPSATGVLPTGVADLTGSAPASGDSFFGAYYTAP